MFVCRLSVTYTATIKTKVDDGIVAPPSPDLAILVHLAGRTNASAAAIGISCRMTAAEVRARLVSLESRRLVASRSDRDTVPPRRVYYVTGEGRRAAGVNDARATTS